MRLFLAAPACPVPVLSPFRALKRAGSVLLAVLVLLGACSLPDDRATIEQSSPDELYQRALVELGNKNYETAGEIFERIELLFPYSSRSINAQINAAYAYYLDGNYDKAQLVAERFIQLHPANEQVVYANFLQAMASYEQIYDVRNDQAATRKAIALFEQLIGRYPDSPYAGEARALLVRARASLAGHTMEIGRYYQERGEFGAAIGRFTEVIEDFQTTNQVPEALLRLVESWLALGVIEEAQRVASVLGHNFPTTDWYRDAYALLEGNGALPEAASVEVGEAAPEAAPASSQAEATGADAAPGSGPGFPFRGEASAAAPRNGTADEGIGFVKDRSAGEGIGFVKDRPAGETQGEARGETGTPASGNAAPGDEAGDLIRIIR